MHVTCRLDVNLMFCIKISATKHAQLYINITGEIFIWKCTAACSHHLHSTLELRNTWKIKFQKRGSKIPTLLLCCYSQTKGRSPKPLASPHGLSAARKNTEKSWVSNEGNCRAGGPGAGTGWHRGPCVGCAVPMWVLCTGVGKVGEVGTGASPTLSWELSSTSNPAQTCCHGRSWEAFRADGHWVWTWGHCKVGPNITVDVSWGTFFSQAQPRCHSCTYFCSHRCCGLANPTTVLRI